jgi:membrane-associated phospholipid phosphatase
MLIQGATIATFGTMDKKVEAETGLRPPHRRLAAAVAGAHRRLMRGGGGGGAEPNRTRAMSIWLAVCLVCTFAAGLTDAAAIHAVRGSDEPVIRFMAWITDIGKSQWYLVPAGVTFCAVGLIDWSSRGPRPKARLAFLFGQAAFVFSSIALAGIFVNIVKVFIGRARPRLIDEVGAWHFDPVTFGYLNASFPSGHSTTVGALTGILMVWYPRWSPVFIVFGFFFAATRIAAGAHYPSDVMAGFTVGLFFSIVIARWLASRGVVFRFATGKILPTPALVSPRKSRN